MSIQPMSSYEHYSRAEELFQDIDHIAPQSKAFLLSHLEKAYEGVQEVPTRLAPLLHMYGRCVYGDMERALPFFQLSLSVQLVSLCVFGGNAVPDLKDVSLSTIPEAFKGPSKDSSLEELFAVIEKNPGKILEGLGTAEKTETFLVGKNLRWFGHVLQNLPAHRKPEYLSRFEAIYGLAKKIFAMVPGEAAHFEGKYAIAYNTTELLYGFRHPGDTEGAFAELMKLEPLLKQEKSTLSVQEMLAQLYNKRALRYKALASETDDETEKKELLQKGYENGFEAVRRAVATPGFDVFLKTLFTHNKANIAIACREAGIPNLSNEEIQKQLDVVVQFMEQTDYDHFYHVGFLCTVVKFELSCNRTESAIRHLTRALNLYSGKFSKSCDEEDAAELSGLVREVRKKGLTFPSGEKSVEKE